MKNDITYIALILGLFVLAFGLVEICDRIIGTDEEALAGDTVESPAGALDPSESVAA